ncbi:MAG: cyanoexosortase B system-associated protein [Synechococcales cyanobacterium RM1_1_8]|nr:cyanoexosortase B system-associated protein [Synechococcales cyanobacterium RM1_1_8]
MFIFGAAPGYLQGKWAWQTSPDVAALKRLQQIPRLGLTIPGWETKDQQKIELAGETWSLQTIVAQEGSGVAPGSPLVLLVRPQLESQDKPKVEWTNVQSSFRWTEDELRQVEIPSPEAATAGRSQPNRSLRARFLRAWTPTSTEGLLEWYAWPGGGSPKPGDWFWRDRKAQLKGDRAPWVAVVLRSPIEAAPLAPLEPAWETLAAAAPRVQGAIADLFNPPA